MVVDRSSLATPSVAPCSHRYLRSERGLTLVELMVAIAISLFMIAALVVLYVNNSAARTELDRSSRQIENGRFAVDMMRDDIALAGFYGEVHSRDVNSFVEADPCTTSAASMGWSTIATPTPISAPAAVQGPSLTSGLGLSSWSCSNLNQRANTGFLIVRRLQPVTVVPANALANTNYVQANGCGAVASPFVFATGPGAANFTLTGSDCATLSPVRAYVSRLYFVSTCGVCSPSDGVPTLKMRELQGNAIVDRVISDGIEDLQFEFGLDTNNDGVVDSFVASAAATDWRNVMAVRIRLISRGATASPGYADDKTYDRGNLFSAYTSANYDSKYKRRNYTALVQLPNVAGPRQTP